MKRWSCEDFRGVRGTSGEGCEHREGRIVEKTLRKTMMGGSWGPPSSQTRDMMRNGTRIYTTT